LDLNNPLGFNLLGQFSSPVPPYAPQPISEYDSRGKAYVQSFFNQTRRDFGIIPNLFLEDALNRSDDRFRASLGVVALGLLPPGGLPDELDVLRSLEGNPQDPTDDIPILVALGEEDAFINEEYLQDLKSSGGIPTLWKDEIFVFPRTGHAVHYERPLLFNLLLHKFVRDIER
jgi:pimeloyl-ACP methyl ester carboxylesterase